MKSGGEKMPYLQTVIRGKYSKLAEYLVKETD